MTAPGPFGSGQPAPTAMQTAPGRPPLRRRAALPLAGLALVAPALLSVLVFFVLPLAASVEGAFRTPEGRGLANFVKLAELYRADILFTLLSVGLSILLTGLIATAIAGYLTLGQNPRAVAILRWLCRWPLDASFSTPGLADAAMLGSWLDWCGIVLAFVRKQTPVVTPLLAGAMAARP